MITTDVPAAARHARGASPDRRRAGGRAGGGARGRLAGGRARGLRQAHRLPGPPAAALQRAVGAQQDARAADRGRGGATGWRPTSPSPPTATIVHGDYRLGNTMVADDAPGAARRDLRLGARHDRRPARRRRLPDGHLGAGGRSGGHVVRLAVRRHAARRASPPARQLIAPLRGAVGPLGRRAQLVRGAGAVEGGGVHGGQPQALPGGIDRRRVPGPVRGGRADAGREGAGDRAVG